MSDVNLRYQKVVWKERGSTVSRIVPVAWIVEAEGKTFLSWPNKVNPQNDIDKRTSPGVDWQFFLVVKRKEFYANWDLEADSSEFTTTESEALSYPHEEVKRCQRKRKAVDSNNEETIGLIRRNLAKRAKRDASLPQLPDSFQSKKKETKRRHAIDMSLASTTNLEQIEDHSQEDTDVSDEDRSPDCQDGDVYSSEDDTTNALPSTPTCRTPSVKRLTEHPHTQESTPTTSLPSESTPRRPPAHLPPATTTPSSHSSTQRNNRGAEERQPRRPVMDPAAFQWTMFQKMESLDRKIDLLITKVANLEKKGSGSSISAALRLLPEPLSTKQQVDALDAKLASDEGARSALVEMFSQIGGATPAKLAISIMNRIMDCTAARSFNIRGTERKVSFKGYRLYSMVFEAVKLAFPTPRPNLDKEVQGAIVDNLRAAVTKLKRRCGKADTVSAQQQFAAANAVCHDHKLKGELMN